MKPKVGTGIIIHATRSKMKKK